MPYEHRAPANRHIHLTNNSNLHCAAMVVGDCAKMSAYHVNALENARETPVEWHLPSSHSLR